jgi:phage tail-like protein
MATSPRIDPHTSYNFRVQIDGISSSAFSEASGLTADGEAIDYREGTDAAQNVRKLVGLRKYSNITLKRGYTQDLSLWDWYKNIQSGVPDRRNVSIVLMDQAQQPVLRWLVANAWINKIDAPTFKASGNDVAIESVELVHEGLSIEAGS